MFFIFFAFIRWIKCEEHFLGVFSNIVWKLETSESKLYYQILGELPYPNDLNSSRIKASPPEKESRENLLYKQSYYEELLMNYFRLHSNLRADYSTWIDAHKHFETQASKDGKLVTQLDQDPVETIFSFICSQNNHITRISSLVEKLCTLYGQKICSLNNKEYYNFPSLEALSEDENMETKLRQLGFGYRAKYIENATKEILRNGGLVWLNNLYQMNYTEAHEELMKLPGIGMKVADCICLMSLNFLEAIPVDTHIIQIAQHYVPEMNKKIKSMNVKLYRKIGDAFREVYGEKAGWAQTVLFCKELSRFIDENKDKPHQKKKKLS